MKPKVYLETSVLSYLCAKPSRDIIVAGHQRITWDWWEFSKENFELYGSQLVLSEAEKGDQKAAKKRLEILAEIPLLELRPEAFELAQLLIRGKVVPEKVAEDAFHMAIATVYGMDYLLSWNCRHIANARIQKKAAVICASSGFELPTICTPEALMEE
jgi:hypothetical protein